MRISSLIYFKDNLDLLLNNYLKNNFAFIYVIFIMTCPIYILNIFLFY